MIFYLVTFTLKFDLLLKNFKLDSYMVMAAARQASLSFHNSYCVSFLFHAHVIAIDNAWRLLRVSFIAKYEYKDRSKNCSFSNVLCQQIIQTQIVLSPF